MLLWRNKKNCPRIITKYSLISPLKICTCTGEIKQTLENDSMVVKNACGIGLDKSLFFNQKVSIFFLFLDENICCGYSLEAPHRGASNEYPQHMFLWRNKKSIYLILTLI